MPCLCKTLSSFELPIATGWQSAIAAVLLGIGGVYLVGKIICWTATLLSIFVLPGKPVSLIFSVPWIIYDDSLTDVCLNS